MNILVKICTLLLAAVAMNAVPTKAIDCATLGGLSECMRPADSVNATGQFICRRRFVNGINRVEYQTLCIAKDWGRNSDRCGCCNGVCPAVCGQLCPNPAGGIPGELGVWVYDWESWWPSRMCVTKGRSLQLQQQNPVKWVCVEYPGWFAKMFGSNFDEKGNGKIFP